MRRAFNIIREVEWYAIIALVLLAVAVVLAVLIAVHAINPLLWVLAIVLSFAAVVSAIFSYRT